MVDSKRDIAPTRIVFNYAYKSSVKRLQLLFLVVLLYPP